MLSRVIWVFLSIFFSMFLCQFAFSNAQRVGGYEFAIDAPWRIEMRPTSHGMMGWERVPIYISFSDIDALDIHGHRCPEGGTTLEKVIAVCKDAKTDLCQST